MTTLSTAVESSLETIRDINEHINRLRDEAKEARKAAVEPFLAALAASGEVSLIVIYGYTPGFNDGEPCEHSADFFVNVDQAFSEELHERGLGFELPDELIDGCGGDDATSAEACRAHGHVWAKPSNTIVQAISDVLFDTAEEENGTDYFVTYILKDGKFEVETGDYDCGH